MNLKSLRNPRMAVSGTASKTPLILAASLFLCACCLAPRAGASIYTLNPGGDQNPALGSVFPTGGTVVGTNGFFFSSGTLNGEIQSTVLQGDPSNPYGGLTFLYSVGLFSSSSDSLSEITVGSYGGFSTDVSYNTLDGGVTPSNFTRSAGTGDVLHFFFSNGGGVPPNGETAIIVVQTSATGFGTAMGGVIDSIPANVSVLAPVPEPAIGSLFVTALGAFLVLRRRSS